MYLSIYIYIYIYILVYPSEFFGSLMAKAQHKCNKEVAAFNCCESLEEAPTSWDSNKSIFGNVTMHFMCIYTDIMCICIYISMYIICVNIQYMHILMYV